MRSRLVVCFYNLSSLRHMQAGPCLYLTCRRCGGRYEDGSWRKCGRGGWEGRVQGQPLTTLLLDSLPAAGNSPIPCKQEPMQARATPAQRARSAFIFVVLLRPLLSPLQAFPPRGGLHLLGLYLFTPCPLPCACAPPSPLQAFPPRGGPCLLHLRSNQRCMCAPPCRRSPRVAACTCWELPTPPCQP